MPLYIYWMGLRCYVFQVVRLCVRACMHAQVGAVLGWLAVVF